MFGGIFGKFMLSQLYRKIELKEQISNQTHKAVIVQHYMRGIKELHRWDKVLELKDGCGAVIWGGGGCIQMSKWKECKWEKFLVL